MSDVHGGSPAPRGPGDRGPATWPVALGLVATIVGAAGFVVAYARDAGLSWLGGTLAVALLGLGLALAYWGRDLAGDEILTGPYPIPNDDPGSQAALGDRLQEDARVITRRRFLHKLLIGAAGVFALSQVALAFSLGPRPKKDRRVTGWGPGTLLVTVDGRTITRDALADGGVIVAFPEGGVDRAGSQVALLRIREGFTPLPGRESWSPEGFVAYSRVCTHAGCAVVQYEDEAQVLSCPCHQSVFDVLDGARPIDGPAGRPLPQLPLAIDGLGRLYAQRGFTEPVGPGAWNAT